MAPAPSADPLVGGSFGGTGDSALYRAAQYPRPCASSTCCSLSSTEALATDRTACAVRITPCVSTPDMPGSNLGHQVWSTSRHGCSASSLANMADQSATRL